MPYLSWINLADAATNLAATREANGLGVRNLLSESVSQVWRVPPVAAGTITDLDVTLSATSTVGVIALFAPRDSYLPPGYTVEVLGSTTSLGGSEALFVAESPLGLAAGRGAWRHYPAAPVSLRFLRLRLRAGANDTYAQFGRLWIGPTFRKPGGPLVAGFRRGWNDSGVIERAPITAIPSVSRGATHRISTWGMPTLTDAEADEIESAAAAVGTTGQIVSCSREDRGARDLVLGRFAAPPAPQAISPIHFSCDISTVEDT